jgi:hypothetical protein
MTRKHFQVIAAQIAALVKTSRTNAQKKRAREYAERAAMFCAQQNPRFDRDRFFTACGLGQS